MKFLFLCVFSLLETNVQGINNGILTTVEDNPFMVVIHTLKDTEDKPKSLCTGSIIHEKFVLTAAHCFAGYKGLSADNSIMPITFEPEWYDLPVTVYANTNNGLETKYAHKRVAKKVYLRSEWFLQGTDADIAVVELYCEFDFRKYNLRKIKLPYEYRDIAPYVDKLTSSIGYGIDDIQPQDPQFQLKRMDVLMQPLATCNWYNRGKDIFWKDHILCGRAVKVVETATGPSVIPRDPGDIENKIGLLDGDSGGPLVLNGDTLIGVAGGNKSGDDRNSPGIYMSVLNYIEFIERVINNNYKDDPNIVSRKLKTNNAIKCCVRKVAKTSRDCVKTMRDALTPKDPYN